MTKNLILSFLMLVLTVQTSTAQFVIGKDTIPETKDNHVIVGDDTSHVDWTTQYIEAKGWSVMDTARFTIPGQALAMARRGAIVDAQRNLLERIEGVRIIGETVVKDCIAEKDYIYTRLDGILKGAELIGEPTVDGFIVEVRMRVPIYDKKNGVANVMHDALNLGSPNKYNPNPNVKMVDGEEPVVFNLNGQAIDPALFPQIIDEEGNILLDLSKYYNSKNGVFPKYLNMTKDAFNAAGFSKGVRVIDLIEGADGKLKVDTKKLGGKKINWQKVGNFVMKAGGILISLL